MSDNSKDQRTIRAFFSAVGSTDRSSIFLVLVFLAGLYLTLLHTKVNLLGVASAVQYWWLLIAAFCQIFIFVRFLVWRDIEPFLWPLLVFVILVAVHGAWIAAEGFVLEAIRAYLLWTAWVGMVFVLPQIRDMDVIPSLIAFLLAFGLCHAVVMIGEALTHSYIQPVDIYGAAGNLVRSNGIALNSAHLGTQLAVGLVAALYFALYRFRSPIWRWLSLASLIIMSLGVMISTLRSAVIFSALAAAFMVLIADRPWRERLTLVGVSLASAVLGYLIIMPWDYPLEYLTFLVNVGSAEDPGNQVRFELLAENAARISVFGMGAGEMNDISTESSVLKLVVELGGIGTTIAVIAFAVINWQAICQARPFRSPEALAGFGIVGIVALQCLKGELLSSWLGNFYLYFALALMTCLAMAGAQRLETVDNGTMRVLFWRLNLQPNQTCLRA